MARLASPVPFVASMFVVTAVVIGASTAEAQTPPRTLVAAADYPDGVRFIEADERAFLEPAAAGVTDASEPVRLDAAPASFVPRLEVRSELWGRMAAGAGLAAVDATADYDTQTATVRLSHLDDTVSWWTIDEARASMLTRYARIGRGGRTGAEPTALQVLREMRRWRESVVIDVAGFEIEPRRWDQRLLWAEFEQATTLDVTPAELLPASTAGASPPRFFVGETPRDGIEPLDVALGALADAGGVEVTFRLLDGRALPFVYVPGPSLLVDVTGLEVDPAARVLALPAFEVSPSVAITLERIVATEGAPLADGENERLSDGGDGIVFGPQPASAAAPAAAVAPSAPPAPPVVRSFNEAVAVVVANVEREATTFAITLLAVAVASVVAGASLGRRASR